MIFLQSKTLVNEHKHMMQLKWILNITLPLRKSFYVSVFWETWFILKTFIIDLCRLQIMVLEVNMNLTLTLEG